MHTIIQIYSSLKYFSKHDCTKAPSFQEKEKAQI